MCACFRAKICEKVILHVNYEDCQANINLCFYQVPQRSAPRTWSGIVATVADPVAVQGITPIVSVSGQCWYMVTLGNGSGTDF